MWSIGVWWDPSAEPPSCNKSVIGRDTECPSQSAFPRRQLLLHARHLNRFTCLVVVALERAGPLDLRSQHSNLYRDPAHVRSDLRGNLYWHGDRDVACLDVHQTSLLRETRGR